MRKFVVWNIAFVLLFIAGLSRGTYRLRRGLHGRFGRHRG